MSINAGCAGDTGGIPCSRELTVYKEVCSLIRDTIIKGASQKGSNITRVQRHRKASCPRGCTERAINGIFVGRSKLVHMLTGSGIVVCRTTAYRRWQYRVTE